LFWDNTNARLGIGTTTSAAKLTISGAAEVNRSVHDTSYLSFFNSTNTVRTGYIQFNAAASTDFSVDIAQAMTFKTNATERMRIDSAGNVGLGVTPQSWYANTWAIELGNRYASIYSGSGQSSSPNIIMATNSYSKTATGLDTYIATGYASKYVQSNANHIWYNAPSGTAGTSITFTQSMTLDPSGNLGLGVTPSAWGTGNSVKAIQLNSGALWNFSTTVISLIQNAYYNGTSYIYSTTAAATRQDQSGGAHTWYTAPSGTAGTAVTFTQAMTLSNTGLLNIAGLTASSAVATDVNKNLVSVATTGSGSYVLATSPTLVRPNLGTPSTLVGTNITGTAAGLSIGGNAATATALSTATGSAPSYSARAFVYFQGVVAVTVISTAITYTQTTTTVVVTLASHGYQVGHRFGMDRTTGTAIDGIYEITAVTTNTLTYTAGTSLTTSGTGFARTCTILNDQNVFNVAYDATGVYGVNFTTAMPSANYAVTGNCSAASGTGQVAVMINRSSTVYYAPTAQSVVIFSRADTGGAIDSEFCSAVVYA
jgi:hypothetical protein